MRDTCKLFILLTAFGLSIVSFSHASRIYLDVPNSTGLTYDCPFDVNVMIDSQGEDIMGASLKFDLSSGMSLVGLSFGQTFNMNFPLIITGSNILAYGFKFPGVISGVYQFATIRLSQSNVGSSSSILNFLWKGPGETTDFVDVYYFGGADSLKEIQNKDFVFTTGPCLGANVLSNNTLSTNPFQHMAAIQQMIDDYQHPKQSVFFVFVQKYIYIIASIIIVLLLGIAGYVILQRRRKHSLSQASL